MGLHATEVAGAAHSQLALVGDNVMPRFEVFSGTLLVGWSELELGDAPMGVAFGRFLPAPDYAAIRSVVAAASGGPLPDSLQLIIRDRDGLTLEAIGGVHLVDCSAELGVEGLEVSILGVPYPNYLTLFPQHVTAYEHQFKNADSLCVSGITNPR